MMLQEIQRGKIEQKGDSLHGGDVKRLLVLPLLAACGHGVTLDVPTQNKLTALACDAERACQQHGNLSDENWPLMPIADGACVNFSRTWLQTSGVQCGVSR